MAATPSPKATVVIAADELAARRRECEAALGAQYEAGVKDSGAFSVGRDGYADRATRLAIRRLRAQGLDPTPFRVADAIERAAGADLYLATACEAGDERAWRVLVERYEPRMRGLAARRGESPQQAESMAADLLADLALPPPSAGARTLLGTFDGAGSLFAWLALILVRRIAAAAKRRRPRSLDAAEDRDDDAMPAAEPASTAPDPSHAALDRESAHLVTKAMTAAWGEMTEQERLALLYRHRDGLSGREMAPLLRVGEPRVSRLVAQAVKKLSAALKGRLSTSPVAGGAGASLWSALRDAVAARLAIFPGTIDPPGTGSPPRPARSPGDAP